MRKAGILLHISSLPNQYGIGTLGKEAYDFVDFLVKSKQKLWQVLPICPTSFGDSPYQTTGSFGGNPYFIDFDLLKEEGLLKEEDYDYLKTSNSKIDYGFLYETRYIVLKKAYDNFKSIKDDDFNKFINEESYWLNDFALFSSIKNKFNGSSWLYWPREYRCKEKDTIDNFILENKEEIEFQQFIQYKFYQQWKNLKSYANENGIKIIGDLPIYVSLDSADVWSNPKNYQLNEDLVPKKVAGVPPDAFTETGQLWGNPLYNYKEMKKNNYKWWVIRFKHALNNFDIVRIDHFRGFESYWAVPYGDDTAVNGKWVKGPGYGLFKTIENELNIKGEFRIIAEDLGFLTEEVQKLLKKTGYPGMKILEFAFDPENDNDYMPYNIGENSIVYPGTHDNMTIKGWYLEGIDEKTKLYVDQYLEIHHINDVVPRVIRAALNTKAYTVIIQMQDYLELDNSARMNEPSTTGNNWVWRLEKEDLSEYTSERIRYWTKIYRRD